MRQQCEKKIESATSSVTLARETISVELEAPEASVA